MRLKMTYIYRAASGLKHRSRKYHLHGDAPAPLRGETYDLKGVGNNANSHELLSVVAAVHHERVGETLDDRALCFPETLGGIATGGVRCVDGGADLDIIAIAKKREPSACVPRRQYSIFPFFPISYHIIYIQSNQPLCPSKNTNIHHETIQEEGVRHTSKRYP
jgi:hypothetical protein